METQKSFQTYIFFRPKIFLQPKNVFKPKISLGSKIYFGPKIFFWIQKGPLQSFVWSKTIWVQQIQSKNILLKRNLAQTIKVKINLFKKIFGQIIFGSKEVWSKKTDAPQKLKPQKNVVKKIVSATAELLLIWTNVTKAYVA